MTKLDENAIEVFAVRLCERLGYQYKSGKELAPSICDERKNWEDVLLLETFRKNVARLNPELADSLREEAVQKILRLHAPELIARNESFCKMLTDGVKVTRFQSGDERGEIVKLIDFEQPENNDFLVVNQFSVTENHKNYRPDVVLFVNGLPLVVLELKSAVLEKATLQSAYQQLQTYKSQIPSLLSYNAILVISDGCDAKVGSLSASMSRFMAWKSVDGKTEPSRLVPQLEVLINGLLNKATLLDVMRHFTVFQRSREEYAGITTIKTDKKIAAYHQYYAVNKAVASTLKAAGADGNRKGGVVWHTQGSGKSLSMVFYAGKIVQELDNPTILVLTDRNDLDGQLFDTFASCSQQLRQEPQQAESRSEVKELLKVASGGIVFSTIQKFQPDDGNVYDTLSDRSNIVVIVDEAHRTQYGFKAKNIDTKGKNGETTGIRTVYGFAKYLRDALPNATYLGFTGTPIELSDKSTPAVFGDYVDTYDIAQSIADKATVPIYYESRLAKIKIADKGRKEIEELQRTLDAENEESESETFKTKHARLEALIGSKSRITKVAQDMVSHFAERQKVIIGKGMIVCASRTIASSMYGEIINQRPDWHHDNLTEGKIKIVMTASADDGPALAKHHTTTAERHLLAKRMREINDELQLVIVCDMWLTGFDVPCLHTMYLDKPMKGHSLMQAIARVNRVYGDKTGGLIVDYLGIAAELKDALAFYANAGGKGDPVLNQEVAVQKMQEKLEIISAMFHGFDYQEFFNANTQRKLAILLESEEHILGLDDGKKRFLTEVAALSAAFSLAIPHEDALCKKEEVAFFQSIRSRLAKFSDTSDTHENGTERRNSSELDSVIRQVIDGALVTDNIVDVFDAAGIKKPNVSILSDEFLAEIRGMKHRHIALEILKKLLGDEIKIRGKTNLVQGQQLLDQLEKSILRYQNKIITAAEFMEELIHHCKSVAASDTEAANLGMKPHEYAFYTAVASNDSARELMEKSQLRELAVELYRCIRQNASIDWSVKESVRAKLRSQIARLLKHYGYPPDMQLLATETVMKQAEAIANEMIFTN